MQFKAVTSATLHLCDLQVLSLKVDVYFSRLGFSICLVTVARLSDLR